MISHKIIKYVPPPVQQGRVFNLNNHQPVSEADLLAHLVRFPFKIGDWVIYKAAVEYGITAPKCSVVVGIERDVKKVKGYAGTPKPFLLMQLTGTADQCRGPGYTFSKDPWCRYDDGGGLIVIDEETRTRLNDDYVQNYIKEYADKAETFIR
jgi:hypothetical protein